MEPAWNLFLVLFSEPFQPASFHGSHHSLFVCALILETAKKMDESMYESIVLLLWRQWRWRSEVNEERFYQGSGCHSFIQQEDEAPFVSGTGCYPQAAPV